MLITRAVRLARPHDRLPWVVMWHLLHRLCLKSQAIRGFIGLFMSKQDPSRLLHGMRAPWGVSTHLIWWICTGLPVKWRPRIIHVLSSSRTLNRSVSRINAGHGAIYPEWRIIGPIKRH